MKNAILGGPGRNIKIWDSVAGEQINSIKKHPDWLLTAAYSPDGVIFATGGRNGGLYIWESATGYEFYTLKGHTAAVTDLAWRADGNVLASCSEDGQVMLWEMREGNQVKKWEANKGGTLAITYAPNGNLATVGRDKTVKIWQGDGKLIRSIDASKDIILSVAYSEDSKRVFTGDWYGNINVWDVETGKELAEIDANPPTIDQQLAYSEQRITELTGKIPHLEKGAQTISKELTDARSKLGALDAKIAEATKTRDEKKNALAALDAKLKTLLPQLQAVQKASAEAESKIKQTDGDIKSLTALLEEKKKRVAQLNKEIVDLDKALGIAANAVEAAKLEAAKPVLVAEQQAKHDALAKARTEAENQKKSLDATISAKWNTREELAKTLEATKTKAAQTNAALAPQQNAVNEARTAVIAKTAEKGNADSALIEASKDGKTPSAELVASQTQAIAAMNTAVGSVQKAEAALAETKKNLGNINATIQSTQQQVAAADGEIAKLKEGVPAKVDALAKAEAAYAPLQAAAEAGRKRVEEAKADLAAKSATYQKTQDGKNERSKELEKTNQEIAATTTKIAQLKTALAEAQKQSSTNAAALAAKKKEVDDTNAQLASNKTQMQEAENLLAATTKQKEEAKGQVDAIVKKESETKNSLQLAKAELKDSQFLAQKWKAAAINLSAHRESEELEGMSSELEGMKENEGEARKEAETASTARADAEKVLSTAEKTVAEGSRKLEETSSTVLDRALQLVSNRAIAQLREQAINEAEEIAPTSNAYLTLGSMTTTDEALEEQENQKAVETAAAETLAHKTPEEIASEVEDLRNRLTELQTFLESDYTEADKMKQTVNQASKVARDTPKVIAERTDAEKKAIEELAEAEAERIRQEQALAEQKKMIEELRAKYLAILPKRE